MVHTIGFFRELVVYDQLYRSVEFKSVRTSFVNMICGATYIFVYT